MVVDAHGKGVCHPDGDSQVPRMAMYSFNRRPLEWAAQDYHHPYWIVAVKSIIASVEFQTINRICNITKPLAKGGRVRLDKLTYTELRHSPQHRRNRKIPHLNLLDESNPCNCNVNTVKSKNEIVMTTLVRIGNSQGVRIPKAIID